MTFAETILVAVTGVAAGAINTVVGSGTLVTFPVLLSVGVPPVAANIANNVGLAPGSVSGAIGYRSELTGPKSRVVRLAVAAVLGGLCGSILLLALPSGVFQIAAVYLVGAAVILVIAQPFLERWLATSRVGTPRAEPATALTVSVFLTSAYGGYFGAGQGVILL